MLISRIVIFQIVYFHDITINNCKGLKNAFFENINFGTIETPVILSDEKAFNIYLTIIFSYCYYFLPYRLKSVRQKIKIML